jgi:hypothetical protein
LIAVPKSTAMQAPVGAQLLGAIDPDRHPGLERGANHRAAPAEVALDHLLELMGERRDHRGHDRRIHISEPQVTQAEQVR